MYAPLTIKETVMRFDFEGEQKKMEIEAGAKIRQETDAEKQLASEVQELSDAINGYAGSHGFDVQITRKENKITLTQGVRTFAIETEPGARFIAQIDANRPRQIHNEKDLMREIIGWLR
jgi:hypothetical protein